LTRESWKDLLETVGVVAIVASLIFVAAEIRTNTQSNEISIEQNYSDNWLLINAELASNSQLADVVDRALSNAELTGSEQQQLGAFVRLYLSQAFHMLRLYDEGLISEQEARGAFRAIREYAVVPAFRTELEKVGDERRRRLLLDGDGLDRWLNDS
jgi:hypothetical protein